MSRKRLTDKEIRKDAIEAIKNTDRFILLADEEDSLRTIALHLSGENMLKMFITTMVDDPILLEIAYKIIGRLLENGGLSLSRKQINVFVGDRKIH